MSKGFLLALGAAKSCRGRLGRGRWLDASRDVIRQIFLADAVRSSREAMRAKMAGLDFAIAERSTDAELVANFLDRVHRSGRTSVPSSVSGFGRVGHRQRRFQHRELPAIDRSPDRFGEQRFTPETPVGRYPHMSGEGAVDQSFGEVLDPLLGPTNDQQTDDMASEACWNRWASEDFGCTLWSSASQTRCARSDSAMPTRHDVRLRHARHLAELLRVLSERERESPDGRSDKLRGLDDIWAQIATARAWALEIAETDPEAQRVVAMLEEAGIEVAQVQAETRSALQRLKDSLLASDDEDGRR